MRDPHQFTAAADIVIEAGRKAAQRVRIELIDRKITQVDFADRRRRQRDAIDKRIATLKTYWSATR